MKTGDYVGLGLLIIAAVLAILHGGCAAGPQLPVTTTPQAPTIQISAVDRLRLLEALIDRRIAEQIRRIEAQLQRLQKKREKIEDGVTDEVRRLVMEDIADAIHSLVPRRPRKDVYVTRARKPPKKRRAPSPKKMLRRQKTSRHLIFGPG